MEIGIDSFAARFDDAGLAVSPVDRMRELLERIAHADQVGLDVFGVGEHHKREFLDSAPPVILALLRWPDNLNALRRAYTWLAERQAS
jgi:hypothetical protein